MPIWPSRFPDGQLYVNLRGFDPGGRGVAPAQAIRGFLDALGVAAERIPTTLDAQVALYRSLLSDKRVLVVLDNARDAEQVRPLLPGAPAAVAVVTSRNQLAPLVAIDGARPLMLDLLSTEEARDLLARRLGAERVAAEPEAVEHIITACARLPLALAVAAARAHQSRFSLATVAAELADPGERLEALDAGDVTSQVRAVFSWSYTALTPPAARLFRLLGLHPGLDISVPAAASLAGHRQPETRRLLTELTRANLIVEHLPGRYAFHDLLRAYAADLTLARDPDDHRRAALTRMLDYYLHTAHAGDRLLYPQRAPIRVPLAERTAGSCFEHLGDHHAAMVWFAGEHRVLVAALRLAADTGLDTQAWQLARALGTFLDRRGHWHDLLVAGKTAEHAAERLNDPGARADAHLMLAFANSQLECHGEARTHNRHALDLYARIDDRLGQATVHNNLAVIEEVQGNLDGALHNAQQSLALYQAVGYRQGEARATTLTYLGDVYRSAGDSGDSGAAGNAWRQALDILTDLDHPNADAVRTKLYSLDSANEASATVRP